MPGIVGLITRMPRPRAAAELRRMLGSMAHEPFYTTHAWMDDDLGVYVGWTAREGSFADAGAQENESGDTVLIFSGEEFPPAGTIQDLKARGHRIGDAHTSYIVHLYEDDPLFPADLNGFFHGLVVDRRRRTIALFNDRYGMHRLYVHEARDAVYFAAEAKAILAVRPELRTIDPRGLGECLTLGCVLENRTIFEHVHTLPGASLWLFGNGRWPRKTTYFQPQAWEEQPPLEPEDFYNKTRETLAGILPRYFVGPERIGMSLTGGLDSRIIMAWHNGPPGSLPAYTWCGMYRDCQDVLVARRVASVCGQPHRVITLGDEFLSRFAYYADRAVFLTDGLVDVSAAADVYMNRRAREIAPARITGLYGGEVLRRVRMFKPVFPQAGLFEPELVPHFEHARDRYEELRRGHPLSFNVFRQAPWHHYSNLALEQSQITVRTPFMDNDFVKTIFRAPSSLGATSEVSLRLIADGNRALGRIPTDRGVGARTKPFERLAHAVQELSFKAEYAYDHGMPQWLARIDHLFESMRLERLFLGRHKPVHFRLWYRDRLAGYVRGLLLDSRSLSRAYVQRRTVERIVNAHTAGTCNYTAEIHKLLRLELVHRQFIDAPIQSVQTSKQAASIAAYA